MRAMKTGLLGAGGRGMQHAKALKASPRIDFIAVCDLEGDGVKEIAVTASGFPFGNALLIFDASGNCKYYEEFGDVVWDIARLRSGGQGHLVVQLTTRLLIYP